MDNHHRYVLAAALLSGDRDAQFILADLLEEQGETDLAKWARQGGKRSRHQVELAIMLLPWQAAIALAIDFVEVAFDALDWTVARRWLAGEVSREVMIAYLRGPLSEKLKLWYHSPHVRAKIRDWDWSKRNLADRVHASLRSAIAQIVHCSADDPRAFHENEARLCVRRVVAQTWHHLSKHLEHWPRQRTIETLRNVMTAACCA